jgi:hypothetical protein
MKKLINNIKHLLKEHQIKKQFFLLNIDPKSNGREEGTFSFNENLSVNIHQDIIAYCKDLTEIPFQLGIVVGDVDLSFNQLPNLKNIANHIAGSLIISFNPIIDLTYLPNKVTENIVMTTVEEKEFKKFDSMEYFKELHIICDGGFVPEYLSHFKHQEDKKVIKFIISFDEFKIYIENLTLEAIIKPSTKLNKVNKI